MVLRVTYTGPTRDYQTLHCVGIYYPDKTSFAGLGGKWTYAATGGYMQETTGGSDASWIANGPYWAKVYSSSNSTPWFVGPVAYTGGGTLNINVDNIAGAYEPPPTSTLDITNTTAFPLTVYVDQWKGTNHTREIITIPPGHARHFPAFTNAYEVSMENWYWTGDLNGWATNRTVLSGWLPTAGTTNQTANVNNTSTPSNPNNTPVFNGPTTDEQKSANAIVDAIQHHEQSTTKGLAAQFQTLQDIRDNTGGTKVNTQGVLEQSIALGEVMGRVEELTKQVVTNSAAAISTNTPPKDEFKSMEEMMEELNNEFLHSSSNRVNELKEMLEGKANAGLAAAETLRMSSHSGSASVWSVPIGTAFVNLDPRQTVGPLMTWIHQVILFGLVYFYVAWAHKYFTQLAITAETAAVNPSPTGPESIGSVATTKLTLIRIVARFLMQNTGRTAIVVLTTAMPGLITAYIEGKFGGTTGGSGISFAVNPFFENITSPWLAEGVALLNETVPLATSLVFAVTALSVRVWGMAIWLVTVKLSRIIYLWANGL